MDNRNKDNQYRNEGDSTRRNVEGDRFQDFNEHRDDVNERDNVHHVSNSNSDKKRLHFLDDLSDYKVASDDPDVRGWTVVDVNDRPVGKVDNLLVDMKREKVRYLDVDLDEDIINEHHEPYASSDSSGVHEYRRRDGDTHMIVPIGLARVDSSNKRVISDEINRNILEEGHLHRRGQPISPDHERKIITSVRDNRSGYKSSSTESSERSVPGNNASTTPSESGSSVKSRTESRSSGMSSDTKSSGFNPSANRRNTPGLEPDDMRNPEDQPTERGRDMRRPNSPGDTNFSRSSEPDNLAGNSSSKDIRNESSNEPYRESRDRSPESRDRGLKDESLNKRTGERESTPVEDSFYKNKYFDENRFYGRK